MLWAGVNDLGQRILTWNKQEQRATMRRVLREAGQVPGQRVLDFGCGTGLFATALAAAGLDYVGYDIDPRLIAYGRRLYGPLEFTDQKDGVVRRGPYDFVVANCCFHHLSDEEVGHELDFIRRNLAVGGRFVLIDLLAEAARPSPLQHVCGWLEQGSHVRRHNDHLRLVAGDFEVVHHEIVRSHLLSIPGSRFYSSLGSYVCRPRPSQAEPAAGSREPSLKTRVDTP